MDMKLDLKSWRIVNDKDGVKIAGEYAVKCGATEVAKASFNDTDATTHVNFPPELLAEALALDAKVREAIVKHYTS